MNWSPQQEHAIKEIKGWISRKDQQVFRLFGFAGTGKTTLTKEVAEMAKGGVLYGAFTGKAASVMRRKGCEGASTIHSMIYKAKHRDDGHVEFALDKGSAVKDCGLVVIDECSMVDDKLGEDLLSFGKPVLVIGDPAQLPPIRGQGFFTNAIQPDAMLTEVHRQAVDNPIIRLSMKVREGERLAVGDYGTTKVIKIHQVQQEEFQGCDQVIVGLNKTRHRYNGKMRVLRGIDSPIPTKDEKVICLKNDRTAGVFNGSLWNVKKSKYNKGDQRLVNLTLDPLDEEGPAVHVEVLENFFRGTEGELDWRDKKGTQEFTFGYAITAHKSQGSQWDHCMVFDESHAFRENQVQWTYTAVTRAAERLTLVIP